MEKYDLTDEHRARLPAWRDKWISNVMRTKPMSPEEREQAKDAVEAWMKDNPAPVKMHVITRNLILPLDEELEEFLNDLDIEFQEATHA